MKNQLQNQNDVFGEPEEDEKAQEDTGVIGRIPSMADYLRKKASITSQFSEISKERQSMLSSSSLLETRSIEKKL